MNERFLSKAKSVDNGEWVTGYYGIKGKGTDLEEHYIMKDTLNTQGIEYFYFTDVLIDPTTLCQCTGLKDKNGLLVFENDLIGFTDDYGNSGTGKVFNGLEKYNYPAFDIEEGYADCNYLQLCHEAGSIEVLGNVSDKENQDG